MADEEAAALRSFFQNAGAGPFLLSTTDAPNRPPAGVPARHPHKNYPSSCAKACGGGGRWEALA